MAEKSYDLQDKSYLASCIDHIENELQKKRIDRKLILKAVLLCEEAIIKLSKPLFLAASSMVCFFLPDTYNMRT